MSNNIMHVETSIEQSTRTEIDLQIATAKKWPRMVQKSIDNVIDMVINDDELALSCTYKLPRGGKAITGPSVRLAELMASSWGNLRVKYEIIEITNEEITARGIAHDLETNFAASVDIKRSIIGKNGRYTNDMIIVTGNAAGSIALRNAIFKVIPRTYVNKVEQAANRSLSEDKDKLPSRVEKCFSQLESLGVTEKQVFDKLKVESREEITARHLVVLAGTVTSINDGLTTIREEFERAKPEQQEAVLTESPATQQDIDDFLAKCAENEVELDGGLIADIEAKTISYVRLKEEWRKIQKSIDGEV
jgi:hypothetical protein